MSHHAVRRLRPYLFHGFKHSQPIRSISQTTSPASSKDGRSVTHDYEKRVKQLETHKPLTECYPRLPKDYWQRRDDIATVTNHYARLEDGKNLTRIEKRKGSGPFTVHGTLLRSSGMLGTTVDKW
jgi:hypothetical protein